MLRTYLTGGHEKQLLENKLLASVPINMSLTCYQIAWDYQGLSVLGEGTIFHTITVRLNAMVFKSKSALRYV